MMNMLELFSESDRSAAIVGSSYVEDVLDRVLRRTLRQDSKALDRMFGSNGALGNFGAQIDLGYLLEIYDTDVRDDLKLISKIRNIFAHEHGIVSFTSPEISDRIGSFRSSLWLFCNKGEDDSLGKEYPSIGSMAESFKFTVSSVEKTIANPREHFISLVIALASLLPLKRMARHEVLRTSQLRS